MSRTTSGRPSLGVAVIGCGWMGHAHSRGYLRLPHHYPEFDRVPELVTVADPEAERCSDAVRRYGFSDWTPDWRTVLDDDRIEAVSVTAPNFLHREMAVALAAAGKHLWLEKPVGLSLDDAVAVRDAVRAAGVQASVGFNYRHAPAVERARELIRQQAIGEVTSARFRLFSDYAAHPQGALSWRFERSRGGSGVLGDLVSHGVDLARHLLGDIVSVVADSAIFIADRPRPSHLASHFATAEGGEVAAVENEDYLSCLLRFASGARATLEASRTAVGAQNDYGFEISGSQGMVSWDFRRMGELRLAHGGQYQNEPTAVHHVGPGSGDFARFQPGAGIAMSYDDLKVIEAAGFLRSIYSAAPHGPGVEDAVHSAAALQALADSVSQGRWVAVPEQPLGQHR
ncbi:Gfo/Idh/MocA family protein [Jatrophihabitans sp.]|jgi:predicted dehydrogenase|uniref:Gfo/Idh/MocA family protein n=1 Tax=Jatrophihabitans sp. TaxID=1932789 RepID=UPI002EF96A83